MKSQNYNSVGYSINQCVHTIYTSILYFTRVIKVSAFRKSKITELISTKDNFLAYYMKRLNNTIDLFD